MLLWRALGLVATVVPFVACVALGTQIVRRAGERPWATRWATLALWWMALASLARAHPWLLDAPCRALELKPVATLSLRAWLGSANWIVAYALLCVGLFGGPWRLRIPGQAFGAGRGAAASWATLTMVAAIGGLPLVMVAVSLLPKLLVPEVPSQSFRRLEPAQRWEFVGSLRDAWVTPEGQVYLKPSYDRLACLSPDGGQLWSLEVPDTVRYGGVVGVDGAGALIAKASRQVARSGTTTSYAPDPGWVVRFDTSGHSKQVPSAVGESDDVLAVVPMPGGQTAWVTRPGYSWRIRRQRPQDIAVQLFSPTGAVVAQRVLLTEREARNWYDARAVGGLGGRLWFACGRASYGAKNTQSLLGCFDVAAGTVKTATLPFSLSNGFGVDSAGLVLWADDQGRLAGYRADLGDCEVDVVARPAGRPWQVASIASCAGHIYFIDNTPDGFRLRRVLEATPRSGGVGSWDPRGRLSRDMVILLATCQPWLVVAVALGLLALSQAGTSPWQARCALEASALIAAFGVVIVLLVPTGILKWFCVICDQAFLGIGTSERTLGGPMAGELLLGIGRVVVTVVLLKGCLFGPVEALMPGVPLALPPDRRRQNVRLALVLMVFSAVVSVVPVVYWWY